MQAYYEASVPQPGQEFEFSADSSLQPVHYFRPPLHLRDHVAPEHVHRRQIANAEAEAAAGLRTWTLAVLCRCLSLDNVLLLLTGSPILETANFPCVSVSAAYSSASHFRRDV